MFQYIKFAQSTEIKLFRHYLYKLWLNIFKSHCSSPELKSWKNFEYQCSIVNKDCFYVKIMRQFYQDIITHKDNGTL